MKYLLIPEDDVKRLESARVDLHELAEHYGIPYPSYCQITEALWYVANRKYQVIEQEIKKEDFRW